VTSGKAAVADAGEDERAHLACWLGEPAGRAAAAGDRRAAGEALFWAGDLDGALAALDEAARRDPGDAWALLSRSAVRYRRGDLDGAGRDHESFRRLRPDGAAAPAVAALLAAARGDAAAAGRSADAAVDRSARAPWALALRGALRGRWGDLDAARDDLDAALASETLPWALAARADALNRIGYFWLALEDLDRLRGLLPGDPEPDVLAAAIHRDQAQYADALRRLSRAEAARPGESRFASLRSEVLFVQGKIEPALRELSRALKLAPEDGRLRFERVRLLALAGRDAEAERALGAAALPAPSRDFLLGYLRARRRRWKEAERLFSRVVASEGPEAAPLRERALLYRQVAREMPRIQAPPRPRGKEFRMAGLGYRQPVQTTVEALKWISSCDLIYSNLSDSSVVDFVGLFGLPFRAIVFRRSDQDAFKCARDVMPGFRRARVVGVVTRGHPLFYGRLARRLAVLSRRRGYGVRVPASTSIADTIPALVGLPPAAALGAAVRDCSDLEGLDTRLPLVMYNFSATAGWRATLARKLTAAFGPAHPVILLPGSGDREFSPIFSTAGALEAALQRADEAVTIYLPAREAA
jgi:tetratricopeptide (TPR) repeat protein